MNVETENNNNNKHSNIEGSVMVCLVEGARNRGRQRMCWLEWQHLSVDWSIGW